MMGTWRQQGEELFLCVGQEGGEEEVFEIAGLEPLPQQPQVWYPGVWHQWVWHQEAWHQGVRSQHFLLRHYQTMQQPHSVPLYSKVNKLPS